MKLNELKQQLKWASSENSIRPRNFEDENLILVKAHVGDVFRNMSPGFRLDLNDPKGGENAIGSRLDNAKAHFKSGKFMDPPEVAYNDATGTVDFVDGRHRAVAAFQLGQMYIPFFVYREGFDEFIKLVRTKDV
jgi:hypothetical protein